MTDHPILDGIRVLDLADGIAGPVAALYLAEAGADVVKVEVPGSTSDRSLAGFRTWNRSKRSVLADLTTSDGRATLDQLLGAADVLIHNRNPQEATVLGLDDATLR
jgi:crotonobetainyl-CoA:carnitine CoA-transferase CaiB-like acyl-CoA transferase